MKNKENIIQPAWDLFCKGDMAGAEKASAVALKKLNDMSVHPVPDIMIMKAFYMCRLNQFQNARNLFGRVLEACPDDVYAQNGYLLSLKDEYFLPSSNKPDKLKPNDSIDEPEVGRVLLGLGTGRSGSTTLTKLWREQEGCYCSHEHPSRLPWKVNSSRLMFHCQRFDILRENYQFVGDVSHWWLPYVNTLMEKYKDLRIVVLKRDLKATVDSFLKIKGGTGKHAINHWIDHDGKFWAKNIWDECYPKYETKDMKKAIEHYWEEYYSTINDLVIRFPSTIKVFPTEKLSDIDVQTDLLSHCGFVNPIVNTSINLNKGDALDGVRLY